MTGSTALTNYGNGLLSNSLGGSAVALAASTSTGTVDTTDPYAGNVISELHFDGNLTDDIGRTWTAYGGGTTSATQSKFGGRAMYFDGSDDYIDTPATSDLAFCTGDFTIDFWYYRSALPNTLESLVCWGNGAIG